MVFIAVPALQRNQRNTDRNQLYGRIATSFTNWQSNNNGRTPNTVAQLQAIIRGTGDLTADATNATPSLFQVGSINYSVRMVTRATAATGAVANRQVGIDAGVTQIVIITGAVCGNPATFTQANPAIFTVPAGVAGRNILIGALEGNTATCYQIN